MTTIALRDSLSKPGSQPTEVTSLSEARALPDGAQPIMSETTRESRNIIDEQNDNVFVNTHYYIPFIL